MAEFSKLVITEKGQALLAKMIAGVGNINFTHVSSSNVEYTVEQLEELTSLSEIKQTSLISEKVRASDVTVKIEAAFNNFELTLGYYMRTLGLYAVDPDEGEILYGVTVETSGNCYVPPYNGITVSGTYIQLVITVGNAENVSLEVNPGAVATVKQVNDLANIVEAHIKNSIGSTIIDVSCTYTEPDTEAGTSGEYTITTDVDLQSEDFFCLRFVAPNDYIKDTVFTIGSESYTAVNAGFKENDLVILNFDVSQQKCFFVSGGGDDKSAGKKVAGETFTIDGTEVVAQNGAEIFNDYDSDTSNIATGKWSAAFGCKTKSTGTASTTMGYGTTASGAYSFAVGSMAKATGFAAVAMGGDSIASSQYSFAVGDRAEATGMYSAAIGQMAKAKSMGSIAIGNQVNANGMYSITIGKFIDDNGTDSIAMGYGTITKKLNIAVGIYNKMPTQLVSVDSTTGDIFVIGNGRNDSTLRSNAFRVTAAGDIMGTKSYTASGADYAEMFEWADGNPDNEDRRGLFVTLDGEKIRPASADDDYILGVVSATPSVVADAQTDDWGKKWKTDIFGQRLLDENGAWILNKSFREEENESYVSRLDRKEWAAVGLVGKLILVDNGTCEVNGYCVPANGGKATKSETGYRVLSRVDENHIKVLIK